MRFALAIAALVLAACSSQSTTETKQVTENTPADGRLRAEVHTALAGEYYQRGNFVVALSETRAAIKDDSTHPACSRSMSATSAPTTCRA